MRLVGTHLGVDVPGRGRPTDIRTIWSNEPTKAKDAVTVKYSAQENPGVIYMLTAEKSVVEIPHVTAQNQITYNQEHVGEYEDIRESRILRNKSAQDQCNTDFDCTGKTSLALKDN